MKKIGRNLKKEYLQILEAQQELKKLLYSTSVLQSPDNTHTFILETIALEQHVGVVQSQKDDSEVGHSVSSTEGNFPLRRKICYHEKGNSSNCAGGLRHS